MARDRAPPAAIVLALDHSEAPTHGQPELPCYHPHYQRHCYLPLFIFAGTSHALVTACLRPGKRPPGMENAMILVRLLSYLRHHWPSTHVLVRGDSHFATPEVMEVLAHRHHTDFVFELAGNAVLLRQAAPVIQEARTLFRQRPPWRSPMASSLRPAAASMKSSRMPPPRGLSRGGGSSRRKSWRRATIRALS